jgi:hypothetical protein
VEAPAEDVIRGELSPSERLLWAGRPRQGIVLRAIDAFLIPFSLLWGGFAIFWEVSVIVGGAPWEFAVFGAPMVIVGLYFIFGRFLVDDRQRAKMIYAVTTERVVIVSGMLARRVKSLNLVTLSDLSLTERGDGSGTITFGPVPPFYWWYGAAGWPGLGHTAIPNFELADEARRVYEIVREAHRAAK